MYTQHVTDHPVDVFAQLDRALKNSFQPDIFSVKPVQDTLLQITPLLVKVKDLCILQPRRKSPFNNATSRSTTYHAVIDIFGEGTFDPSTRAIIITSDKTLVRAMKRASYSSHCVPYFFRTIELHICRLVSKNM